eukprot:3367807-Prymnesium_polylepis.1
MGPKPQPTRRGLEQARRRTAQLRELARDRRGKAQLAHHVGQQQDVERRRRLRAAVRAPKLLDRVLGRPRQLEDDVHAARLVLHLVARVQRDARRRRLADDCDHLLALHARTHARTLRGGLRSATARLAPLARAARSRGASRRTSWNAFRSVRLSRFLTIFCLPLRLTGTSVRPVISATASWPPSRSMSASIGLSG